MERGQGRASVTNWPGEEGEVRGVRWSGEEGRVRRRRVRLGRN